MRESELYTKAMLAVATSLSLTGEEKIGIIEVLLMDRRLAAHREETEADNG